MPVNKVKEIMRFYKHLESHDDYRWIRWAKSRRRFHKTTANKFFVGVVLDQGQVAERAWDGGAHLVDNYFNGSDDFWGEIAKTHHRTIKRICQTGYNGKSFAIKNTYNTFPLYLKSAANKIIDEYDSDSRNIWKVLPQDVQAIYDRFTEFKGIGDGLAKMAQFILVRNYGVAGGKANQHLMAIKPDILVRRVLHRLGLTETEKISHTISTVENIGLKSPADFDASTWVVGREYCFKTNPNCRECPIKIACNYARKR
jgi:endonuclease III